MKLNFVLGDNFLDVTDNQISLINSGLKQGNKQLIIVPDRFALTMENLILQKLNLTASFDIDVVSFARLSAKTLTRVQAPQVLSSLSATMVIEMLLLEHEKELKCFGNTIKTIAFASTLFDSISQLKSCKITPSDLQNNLEKITNKSLRLKLEDIALIYRYYEEYLSDTFVDSNNKLKLLCKTIQDSQDFENYDVHFCNFDSITEQGLDVLKMLLLKSKSVSVGMVVPTNENNNKEIYNIELFTSLSNLANNLHITPTKFFARNTLPKEVAHILHNALAIKPQNFELPNSDFIRIYEASNPRQEVEWLAINIANLIKSGGRYKDIAINCSSLESYLPIIKKIFTQYKIPFWSDSPIELQNTEGYKLLQSAIDCVLDNFQAKDVFRFIKNPLLNIPRQHCEIFENVVNKYCITGTLFFKDFTPINEDEEFKEYLTLKQHLTPLLLLEKNIKGSKTIAEYISAIFAFFEQINFAQSLQDFALHYLNEGDLEKNSIFRQTFNKIENIFIQMKDCLGQLECSFTEFNRIWKTGVGTVTISPLPMSLDCVFVGQSLQSIFSQVDHYFILGAIDGNFPSYVADVGLIADSDIISLNSQNLSITPSIRQVNSRSRFKILQSLTYGKKSLSISYPANKGEEECKLAPIIESLLKCFTYKSYPLPCIMLKYMLEDNLAFGSQKSRFSYLWTNKYALIKGLIANSTNSKVNPKYINSAYAVLQDLGYAKILQQMQSINKHQIKIAPLKNPQKLFFTDYKAGVTQIENFFDCPYKHFLNYGLKLKEKKTARIQAVDIGNILHAVLEKFGIYTKNHGILKEEQIDEIVGKMFDEVLQHKDFEYIKFSGHNDTILESLKTESICVCKAINYQQTHSQYQIKFIETKFGSPDFAPIPEIAVINTNTKIKISGKIDRADICGNRLRIIDYKTSKYSADFKLINFYLGKKIQLFFYLNTILNALSLQAGGAYYFPVNKEYLKDEPKNVYSHYCMQGVVLDNSANLLMQDDQISFDNHSSDIVKASISTAKDKIQSGEFVISKQTGTIANEEQFNGMLNYAKEVLSGAINDIYTGFIEPLSLKDACNFCPYNYICRAGILMEKKNRNENFEVNLDTFIKEEK